MKRPSLVIIAGLLILIMACVAAELLFATISPGPALPQGHLTEAQAKSIEVMLKLCDSFITWAVATIGGTALLLRFNIDKQIPYSRGDVFVAAACMGCAAISVFCGHLAFDLTGRALALNQFPEPLAPVHYFLRFQYLFALAGIGLFAFFALNYFLKHAKRH
jgi:hypothetical protein